VSKPTRDEIVNTLRIEANAWRGSRGECDTAIRLEAAADLIARVPVTADEIAVMHGDIVYGQDGGRYCVLADFSTDHDGHITFGWSAYEIRSDQPFTLYGNHTADVDCCFSTRAAAEAAAKAKGE